MFTIRVATDSGILAEDPVEKKIHSEIATTDRRVIDRDGVSW